ncbi:MAG TPA: hypothetical protein VFA88_11145, partial [Gaiellaceae bacterium]|nr:hypothetical protein [Gaiellaceae bacterium]
MLAEGDVAEIPETLQGIIAARLDGLPADEKALLQDAAVVGKVFWLGALGALGGGPGSELEQRLGEVADRARRALGEAGARALALNAYEAAERFTASALELAEPDSEEWGR